jgi:hypothetical protein
MKTPAALNSVAPSLRTAALSHAGIAPLRRRSLVAALSAALNLFPPSPFQTLVRRAAGKMALDI